jgi:hypothetical protein
MVAILGRIVSDYAGLVEICRQRAVELEISRCGIDSISGLAEGQAGKILGRKQKKEDGCGIAWPDARNARSKNADH